MIKTVQFKIVPTDDLSALLHNQSVLYIQTVNYLVAKMVETEKSISCSSSNVDAALPSAVKNELIRAARSVYQKSKKNKKVPILKKPVITWNNQNFSVTNTHISFPLWADGKSKRVSVACVLTDYQRESLNQKLGSLRITRKSNKWVAQIAVNIETESVADGQVMGVDLGLKIPAVAVCANGTTKFFGNGRENKYVKRKHRAKRKALGKAKKPQAIKSLNNKEQRWMKDKDHKVSRGIVNHAINNNVSIIHLEQLSNIRNTTRTSRKNEKNLHTWSFYRLSQYIQYKAEQAGIKVEYVNPAYTSQTCPDCGFRNKMKDRTYQCGCGYKSHRDRVGALNIISAPVVFGKRKPA
jgi:IS605 OrfB family transposase